MSRHEFLSPDWTEAAHRIRAEYAHRETPPSVTLRMNLVVSDVPFGDGTVDAHVDTSAGRLEIDTGHVDEPDLTIALDYDTAKAILIDQNPQAGMQAFMAGRIRVDGDMSKLLLFQGMTIDPVHAEIAARMREITE